MAKITNIIPIVNCINTVCTSAHNARMGGEALPVTWSLTNLVLSTGADPSTYTATANTTTELETQVLAALNNHVDGSWTSFDFFGDGGAGTTIGSLIATLEGSSVGIVSFDFQMNADPAFTLNWANTCVENNELAVSTQLTDCSLAGIQEAVEAALPIVECTSTGEGADTLWVLFSKLDLVDQTAPFPGIVQIGQVTGGDHPDGVTGGINGWNIFSICSETQPSTDGNGHVWLVGSVNDYSGFTFTPVDPEPECSGAEITEEGIHVIIAKCSLDYLADRIIAGIVGEGTCPCESITACILMDAFDYDTGFMTPGDTMQLELLVDGVSQSVNVHDYSLTDDGISKSTWYTPWISAINALPNWTITIENDVALPANGKVQWRLEYSGAGNEVLRLEKGDVGTSTPDVMQITVDSTGTITTLTDDFSSGNPWSTDPFNPCI